MRGERTDDAARRREGIAAVRGRFRHVESAAAEHAGAADSFVGFASSLAADPLAARRIYGVGKSVSRTARSLVKCLLAGFLFSFLWFFVAWFVNEHLIYPILPGFLIAEKLGGTGAEDLFAVVATLLNTILWGAVFFVLRAVIARRRASRTNMEAA